MNKAETQIGLAPGFRLGGYKLEAACGEGGFAVVYRAIHEKLDRPAAIKVLHARLATRRDLVERFTREAQMITRIHHPNIVDIYDFGTMEDGRPYFVMEWVDGRPLSSELRRRQRFSPEETLVLAREIAAGLSVIHKAGVIHRDLKSNNIMLLSMPDGALRIKLLDFGIAKVLDQASELSLPGMQLGTPETMSPEQIRCGEVSPASDIYAFGILLYELLTGRLPYRGERDSDIHRMQLEAPRPRPSDHVEVSAQVDDVIATCMAVDPADRYSDVEVVVRQLEEALAVHTTAADPIAPGSVLADSYRVTRLLGRGGMGVVYEGEHTRLPHRLAIKVISGKVDRESLVRFRREAEIASGLGHANIIRVLDFNTLPSGTPYMVMEFLEGSDLRDVLKEGPLAPARALSIARQTGSALAAAHAGGIVHRDLKPSNIFLTMREIGGEIVEHVTVLDFGVSKMQDSSTVSTDTRALVGTPQYMAPEQAMGEHGNIDGRSDQFALACLVYEMLSGTPAFSGEKLAEIVYKVCYSEPPALEALLPDIDPAIANTVRRGMAKNRHDRFPDLPSFIAALTGRPLEALPRTRLRRPSGQSSLDHRGSSLAQRTPSTARTPADATRAETPASRDRSNDSGGAALKEAWRKRALVGTAPTMASPKPPADWEDEDGQTESGPTVAGAAMSRSSEDDASAHEHRGRGRPTRSGAWIALAAAAVVVAAAMIIVLRDSDEPAATGAALANATSEPAHEQGSETTQAREVVLAPVTPPESAPPESPAAVDAGPARDEGATPERKQPVARSPKRPAPKPKDNGPGADALPPEAQEALDQASAQLAAGDFSGALRDVRRSMQIKVTGRGFAIMVEAYCGKGNIGAARDYLARVPARMRGPVRRRCQSKYDVDLGN